MGFAYCYTLVLNSKVLEAEQTKLLACELYFPESNTNRSNIIFFAKALRHVIST
jgi:hypothetical protein